MSRHTPGYDLFLTRLIEARTNLGLTIEQLADRMGLPAALVAAYENGEKSLDFVQTHNWCLALGIDFTTFVLQVGADMDAARVPSRIAEIETETPSEKSDSAPLVEGDDGDGEFDELEGGP